MDIKEIKITDIENIKIGHAQNEEAATGVTVCICEQGAPTGLAVFGGGPASREGTLTDPLTATGMVHAVVLGGGSAFGLDAAGGVMRYLEERGLGFDVGITHVPLVCQSDLFDLTVGKFDVRPDQKMAYEACENAQTNCPSEGNVGAGTGASVGKVKGMDCAMKTGLGMYAVQVGKLKIGAIVALNALGDIFDYDTGAKIAGILNESKDGLGDSETALYEMYTKEANLFVGNTTIGIIVTNGKFDKCQMNKIAKMAHNGYARTINPVNTTADGDSIYGMSVGDVEANMDMVGTLAAKVMGRAIGRAVRQSQSAYGLKAHSDIVCE